MGKEVKWWIELVVIIAVFVIGVTGNILVLIILRTKGTRKTIHGIFVTNLAIADLVLLCTDSPASLLEKYGITFASDVACRLTYVAPTTGYNAGLLTITSMAMHRYHVVTCPWRPKLKRRGAVIWVLFMWIAAFVLVIPLIIVIKTTEHGCSEDWPSLVHRQAYTASLMTLQYILPLIITAICYIRIWLFLRSQPVVPQNTGLPNSHQAQAEENSRESVVILKTVAVIVLLFLILLLPMRVAWMLLDFGNVSYYELWFASDILTRLHSCLNPVVYGVMNKQYRQSFIRFLSRMFCCHRPSIIEPLPQQAFHMTNQGTAGDLCAETDTSSRIAQLSTTMFYRPYHCSTYLI